MNKVFLMLIVLISSIGMVHGASAHKSEVFGDYKIEVGWDKEPPLVNIDNKITLKITYAFPEEKEQDSGRVLPQFYGRGVTNLEQDLDVSIMVNNQKTDLVIIEDKEDPGQYYLEYTPAHDGYPVVHVVAIINDTRIETDFHPERIENGALINTSTADGALNASVLVTTPEQNRRMLVMIQFTDQEGNLVGNVNYDISVTQGDQVIFARQNLHSNDGNAKHATEVIQSDLPADINLTILGIGSPNEPQNWTGPVGSTMKIQVVPEFGLQVGIVLASVIMIFVLMTRLPMRHILKVEF
ncbi:MAG: hypothetical protein QXW37_00670 [Candidatus Nitrosotenuis sp.]